jgi:hypothetical protein
MDYLNVLLLAAVIVAIIGFFGYLSEVSCGRIGRFTTWEELTDWQFGYVLAMFAGIVLFIATILVEQFVK